MDFEPSWAQTLIAKTTRDFAVRVLVPKAAARDRDESFPQEEMHELGSLGLLGLCVPEALGGSESGSIALALAVSEIARADASVAVTMTVTNMVAEVLACHASEEVRARVVPRLCAGALTAGAFALSEPQAGSDAAALATSVRPERGGYVLRGSKQWITSGDRAGALIVLARHADAPKDSRRISAFLLEPPLPGLSAGRHERKMGQRGSSTVSLTLDDVFVPREALLGAEGDGFKVAMTALDGGRIGVAAQAIGIARAAFDAATRYARERHQFGQPIGRFGAVSHMLADSATTLEAAWLLTLQAAWRKEQGLPFTRAASEAKLYATERAVEVCDRAVQIFGGYGFSREFPVERYFRDVRVTTIYEGTSQIQRMVIAKNILKELGAHG